MPEITLKSSKERIRVGILAFYFIMGLCFATWASRIPDIKAAIGLSDAVFGTVLFGIPLGQLLGMPFSGLTISRYGSIKVLLIGTVISLAMMLCIGYAVSVVQLFFFLFLFGFFGNFVSISINTQGVYIEEYYQRPIMVLFHGGWSIAGFVGALLGLLAVNLHLDPATHFLGVAGIVILIYLLNFKYLFPDVGKMKSKEKERFGWKKPEKLLIQLGIVGFCSMASEGSMFDWSGVYFKDIVQAPAKLIPLGYTFFMVAMATGRFMADRLIGKYGRQRILQAGGLLIASGLLISILFPHIITCSAGFMMTGLGVSSIMPIIFSVAGQESKMPANIALVIVSTISFVGFLVIPPFVGYISDIFDLRYSYALIVVLGICITLIVSNLGILNKKV